MADENSRWLVGILSYPIVPPNPITLSWLASEMLRSKERARVPGPLFAEHMGSSYSFRECEPTRDSFLCSEEREAAKLAAQDLCTPRLDTSLDQVFEVEVSNEAFNMFDMSNLSGATPAMLTMLDIGFPEVRRMADWTRFEALRLQIAEAYRKAEFDYDAKGTAEQAFLRHCVAFAKHALECGRPLVMRKFVDFEIDDVVVVNTPDEFVSAWEQGWRVKFDSESEGARNMELLREIMERKARQGELISNVSKARTAVRKARRVVCRRAKKWNKLVTVPDADERNRVERLGEAITKLSDAIEALEAAERSLRDAVARARADGLSV